VNAVEIDPAGPQDGQVQKQPAPDSEPLQIACDESGYEGEKLIGATTDVFAHASVRMETTAAAHLMQELRDRIRSPATEYKAGHVLREKHRAVLTWLLGPAGPLLGNAHVYLIDKAFYVTGKVTNLLLEDGAHTADIGLHLGSRAEAITAALYREGPAVFGPDQWEAFLAAANTLMRVKDRLDVSTSVDAFFRTVDLMRLAAARDSIAAILQVFWRSRAHAEAYREQLLDNPAMVSALDPLIPAIVRAVAHWGGSVHIVHDQQNTLSEERIALLKEVLSGADAGWAGTGHLAAVSLVDSQVDARVQVADVIAGTVRKISSDELKGRGDAQLTELVRPYVDACSIWGDDRSWLVLGPGSNGGG
jgi:hypothetical protein